MPRDVFGGGGNVFNSDGDSGPFANRPSASDVPENFVWYATDDNGGTAYRAIAQAWVKLAPGVLETGGRELGYVLKNDANWATANTAATDIPGMSVAFVAGARPVAVKFGASDMSNNTVGAIMLFQCVRTDTGDQLGYIRGTERTANDRIPLGSNEGRMSGLTLGNTYTVKLQTVSTAGTTTIWAGPAPSPGIWLQVVEL